MFGRFGAPRGFTASYRVYPVSFIDRPQVELGDKAIMPPSALERLTRMQIDEFPMTFEVENAKRGRKTHCGVLEFVADEGVVYLPYWMMQNLLLEEGDVVKFTYASPPKGTYVKLQPQTKDFLDISNPKAVLEMTLRNYTCLTTKTFLAFAGGGRRLDGKSISEIAPVEVEIPTTSLRVTKEWQQLRQGGVLGGETSKEPEQPNPDGDIDRKRSGKVVFGGARAAAIARKKEKAAAAKKDDAPEKSDAKPTSSFEAFKGTGNKLR
ncbi:ubiquitin fusion degradation protein UFD1-domain-containing protein [Ostreococcus tauri]|uniref:Ubiquitin fusion degradation protein UFD1-domain-containing protein n=1 Tax=Ostreococcus tauri TaxID=70448 RepID=A0A1Y5IHQ6_OSTTA|nr:ubiquitin fusion degradation protein UFD1-domain-containing protein [Ostreococcus tauri]